MRTAIQKSSNEAYRDIKADGTLGARQKQVLNAVTAGRDFSLQEIAKATGLGINCAAARANELRGLGILELGPTRSCQVTGRSIRPIRRPTLPAAQGALFS